MTFSNLFVILDIFLIECQKGGIGEIQWFNGYVCVST